MKFMRKTTGYTCSDKNLDLMKEINTQPIVEMIENYRCKWEKSMFFKCPIQILCYHPK